MNPFVALLISLIAILLLSGCINQSTKAPTTPTVTPAVAAQQAAQSLEPELSALENVSDSELDVLQQELLQ